MLKQLKNKEKGFTIIEVMIVLAIVGLIMLIVFLAVPALQRNSRNTQRKNDVGLVGSAVQNVLSNNNGSIASLTSTNLQAELGSSNLAYYTPVTQITVSGAASGTVTNGTTVDTVNVYTNAVCAAMTGGRGATSTGATTRSVAIVYSTETGGTPGKNCNDL